MNSMGDSSTLVVAILVVGALSYLGTLAFDPTHTVPRMIAGYVCGATLMVIGITGFYFGASFEFPLMFLGVYIFDALRVEWMALGVVAIVVGALLLRQAFQRQ